jgi:hypothetical protein
MQNGRPTSTICNKEGASMEKFTQQQAFLIVQAAVAGGHVKLIGAENQSNSEATAAARGKVDAAYLVSLLTGLTAPKPPQAA